MSKEQTSAELYVKDFSVFEEAKLTLKPLTILIGGNSVGKSHLLYLTWLLMRLEPNVPALVEVNENLRNMIKGIKEAASKDKIIIDIIKEIVQGYSYFLTESFKKTFGTGPARLSKDKQLSVSVQGYSGCKIEFKLSGNEFATNYVECEDLFNNIEIKINEDFEFPVIRLTECGTIINRFIDIDNVVFNYFVLNTITKDAVSSCFKPWLLGDDDVDFFIDGRAGLIRSIMKPQIKVEGLLEPDEVFRLKYFKAIEKAYEGIKGIDLIRDFLEELGVKDIRVEFERGLYVPYIVTWNGASIPLDISPSGVRESLLPLLSLINEKGKVVIIEEPEAHLHPRAITRLARVIARAVNMGKQVILSTHNDYLLYELSNLIEASELSDDELKRRGLGRGDVLSPDRVAVYLVRAEPGRDYSVLEEVPVSGNGIEEEEFSKVATELAEESSH
ncbi:AAA family ATPase [Vulcanisaeta sp. JCM 16161]|uniref:AAA family ATPase n=1 Tax=Vulcanisaeta sp. JCM 16161 TaxID=1295372 RepID=UPI0006D170DD|nr:AAA family ATPase [Vulcanisaeta sp. JCM 16161]